MAQRRVQVEEATSAAQLRAVASPVETYVKPAQEPVLKSDLQTFVSAISPAIKADAEIRKEQALKLQREAERGIASKRAADVKLGLAKAQREAAQDFLDNQDEYFNLTEEEVAERRERIMQPYFEMAQNSGDKLLMDAFKADTEMANLQFFNKVYDPAKRKRVFENDMDNLIGELIAVSETPNVLGDPELGFTATDQTLAKIDMIEDTFNKYQAASGYSFRDMNDYVFDNAIAPRVAVNGRDALYRWGEQKKLYNVGRYQKTVKTMNSALATRDKALLKAQDPVAFASMITNNITSFLDTGNVGALQVGNKVTLPSGATRNITETDVANAYEAYAASEGLNKTAVGQQMRLDFYKRSNIMPTLEKNVINSGKLFFGKGQDIQKPENLQAAVNAFAMIERLRMSGFDIPESVVDADTQKRFKVIEFHHRSAGMGIADAITMAQEIDPRLKPSPKLRESISKKIGTIFITDHGETSNNASNIEDIADDVGILMQSGIAEDDAIEAAIDIFNKDHVIHTGSNGVQVSFKQLNTDPNISGDVTSTLDAAASAIGNNVQVQNIIKQSYPTVEDAGIIITNVRGNPAVARVLVIDKNGIPHGTLGTVDKRQLLMDEQLINRLIANNIEAAKAAGVNVDGDGDFETPSISSIDDQFISPEDLFLAQNVGTELPTKEEFKTSMKESLSIISEPLKDAGEAVKPFLDNLSDTLTEVFAQDKLDVPDLISETVGTVVPTLSQAKGDITPFFEEEYTSTKRKFSNIKAIRKAQDILEDFPEMLKDLRLDVRGLLSSGGKSARGVTQKQQAAIARSIIAVQNAGERQQDVETSQDLTDALTKAANTKGVSGQEILEKVIKPMAYHESDGTMDPNLKQYGDGIARGVLQFEPDRFKTAVQRAKNYHKVIGQQLPEWISDIEVTGDNKAIQKQITDLSANQQMALAVYDLLQHPTADISKVINGEMGITEFWIENWWSKSKSDDDYAAQRTLRAKSFRKSLAEFEKQ